MRLRLCLLLHKLLLLLLQMMMMVRGRRFGDGSAMGAKRSCSLVGREGGRGGSSGAGD